MRRSFWMSNHFVPPPLLMAALLLLPVIGLTVASQSAIAQTIVQTEPTRTLSVTGRGLETIPTTITEVSLGISVEAETAEDAQQEAARRSTAVVEWLRSQNVDKLATAGISLRPRYDSARDRRVIVGYEAINTLTFRVPTEAAGEIIDEAVSIGATRVNGVSFVASDEAITAARIRALESATQDARVQADAVFAALGLSYKEVVNVTIGSVSAPPPSGASRLMAESIAAPSSPVIGQDQTISAQVTLRIQY